MDRQQSRAIPGAAAYAEPVQETVSGRMSAHKILVPLLIVATVLGILFFASRAFGAATADMSIKKKQYQAVFLANGQVYFGELSKIDSSYVKLSKIYYLQVQGDQQQSVQPGKTDANQSPQVSLAKLGSELHGPEDVMYISRSQVLFWENLKDDGKVAKAIKDYAAQNKK